MTVVPQRDTKLSGIILIPAWCKGVRAPATNPLCEGSFPDSLHGGDVTSSGVDEAVPTTRAHTRTRLYYCCQSESLIWTNQTGIWI